MIKKFIIFLIVILVIAIGFMLFQPAPQEKEALVLEKSEFRYTPPSVITREDALASLMKAEDEIQEMSNYGLSVLQVRDLLLDAKRYYIGKDATDAAMLEKDLEIFQKPEEELKRNYVQGLFDVANTTPPHEVKAQDYEEVFRSTQLISFKKKQAYTLLDEIPLVEQKEKDYRKNKVDTSEALLLIGQAKKAFREERYDDAESALIQADFALDRASSEYERARALITASKNFFVRYWWQIILILVILGVLAQPVAKKINILLSKNKLQELKIELETLKKLVIQAQTECFKDRSITTATYNIRVEKYMSRMAEIQSEIPVLESLVGEKVFGREAGLVVEESTQGKAKKQRQQKQGKKRKR